LDLGYSSVWDYCVRGFGYSSSTAARYIQAARCILAHPELLPMLESRELSVSTLCQIAGILNNDNKESIIERVRGRSRPEVELVAREYRAPVELRDRIVQVKANTASGVQNMVFHQYLAPEPYAEVFEDVKNLMPLSMSDGEIALKVYSDYRDRHSPMERQKRRERRGQPSLHSHRWECGREATRYIPDEVRDVVFRRDGGQCTFVAADGTRCQCRRGLEVDHIKPFANGGTTVLSNLRLLCGGHNRLAAEKSMGKHVMQPHWRRQ
jgi:5-methylcytosine-specific restriction endonuclease McrA